MLNHGFTRDVHVTWLRRKTYYIAALFQFHFSPEEYGVIFLYKLKLIWNPKVHHRVHGSLPLIRITNPLK